MVYDHVADLELRVDEYDLEQHERDTSSGFTRTTTVVSLHGDGKTGQGEDVTYDNESHYSLHDSSEEFPVTGEYTIDEFSEQLSEVDLFLGNEPNQSIFRNYRQWAFESAALDLALKQTGTTLADRLDREYSPVRFVVSTRLQDPGSATGSTVIPTSNSSSIPPPTGPPMSSRDWPKPTPFVRSISRASITGRQRSTRRPRPLRTGRRGLSGRAH